jgi:hypothetical protein
LNWMSHHVHWFFNCFFVKMEVGHTICSPMVPATIVNMDDGGRKWFFHNSVYVNDCEANSHLRRCPPDHDILLTRTMAGKMFFP